MKKSILILAILIMAVIVNAQKIPANSVPEQVLKTTYRNFPELIHDKDIPVKWEKNGRNYKASLYTETVTPASIELDSLGTLLRVERRVSVNTLPLKAREYLKSQYNKTEMEISEVDMITIPGKNSYRTKLIVKPVYMFDGKGELINPENETKSK